MNLRYYINLLLIIINYYYHFIFQMTPQKKNAASMTLASLLAAFLHIIDFYSSDLLASLE